MPIRKVKGGYKWGSKGHVYKTKAGADRQRRAAFAHGYKGKTFALVSKGAIEFACTTKACAPPPVGVGGSNPAGGSSKGYGGLGYANSKLSKSRAPGADPDITWLDENPDADTPMIGLVKTPGGRSFPVAWDEFDVGPQTAKIVINQYAKLLDTYPEINAVPLGIGRSARHNLVRKEFGDDPYYVNQIDATTEKAGAFVTRDSVTSRPLFMVVNARADHSMMDTQPDMWGTNARTLNHTQQRQYIVSHEFGHIIDFQTRQQMSPNMNKSTDRDLAFKLQEARLTVFDIGSYGKSKPVEMVAEAFAMQTHGLTSNPSDARFLKSVTDYMLDYEAPRQIDWQS